MTIKKNMMCGKNEDLKEECLKWENVLKIKNVYEEAKKRKKRLKKTK